MGTYSSLKRSARKGPRKIESEADLEALIEKSSWSRVRMSVEGFNPYRPKNEIKKELVNHFNSCGEVFRVIVPKDPIYDSRAFVILLGHGAEEKALQLNGSSIGGALRYEEFLYDNLHNDERFLPEDDTESKLIAHFSSCGKITHVFVCPLNEHANIYFSKEEGEARALELNGSEVGGFRITTMRVATVRSNRPLAPGEVRLGYSVPSTSNVFS